MTRRRRGRRPEGPREGADEHAQPLVDPSGRPEQRSARSPSGYTPPPSPLTRWQHHGRGAPGSQAPPRGRVPYGAPQRGGQQPDGRYGGGPRGGYAGQAPRGGAPQDAPRSRWSGGAVGARNAGPQGRPRPFAGDDRARARPNPARTPPPPRPQASSPQAAKLDAFDLFCAYHLGITPDGGYRIQNIHEVARRFGTNAAELRQILADLGMAADDIVHSGFDLPSAQVDIMVAPEGISRRELARPLYAEFRSTPKQTRNWAREMEDAQRQIDETIGRDGRWSPAPRDPAGKQS